MNFFSYRGNFKSNSKNGKAASQKAAILRSFEIACQILLIA